MHIGGGEWSRVTMARRSPPQLHTSRRGVVSFRWNLITALSASLCVLALFSIYHRQSRPVPSLSAARSRIPLQKYSGDRPKIAFLFLARHDLPLDFLWDRFFKVRWLSIHSPLSRRITDHFLLWFLAGWRWEELFNLCSFNTWFRIRWRHHSITLLPQSPVEE